MGKDKALKMSPVALKAVYSNLKFRDTIWAADLSLICNDKTWPWMAITTKSNWKNTLKIKTKNFCLLLSITMKDFQKTQEVNNQ